MSIGDDPDAFELRLSKRAFEEVFGPVADRVTVDADSVWACCDRTAVGGIEFDRLFDLQGRLIVMVMLDLFSSGGEGWDAITGSLCSEEVGELDDVTQLPPSLGPLMPVSP